MIRFISFIILVGLLVQPLTGKTPAMPEETLTPEQTVVLAVENAWIQAEIQHDEATLRQVLADDFIHNSNNGHITGKEDLIRSVMQMNMTHQVVSERSVMVTGETAVVCGTAEMHFASEDGEEQISLLRYTATYVRRGGRWQALALQMAGHTGK